MKVTPAQIVAEPDEHVVLTGPITGTVTTSDGVVYDVGAEAIVVPDDQVAEVAHLIGSRYAAEGHPEVEQDFEYEVPKEFAKYEPHADNDTLTEN